MFVSWDGRESRRLFLNSPCLEKLKPAGVTQAPRKVRMAVGEQTEPFERRAQGKRTNCCEVSGVRLVEVTP